MRQLTDSERVAMEKAWDKNFNDEPALSFYDSLEAGFIAARDHSAAQLAALTAERDSLRALVERVVEIGPLLHAGSIADLIYGKTANTYKLTQLLKDCQEALK